MKINQDQKAFANFKELMDWIEQYATGEQCERIAVAVNRHKAYADFHEAVMFCIDRHTISGPGVACIKEKAKEIP